MSKPSRSTVFLGVLLFVVIGIAWMIPDAHPTEALYRTEVVQPHVQEDDLPPGTSPLSKLDLGPFEVHSMV